MQNAADKSAMIFSILAFCFPIIIIFLIPSAHLNAAFAEADDHLISESRIKDLVTVNLETIGPIKFDIPNQPIPWLANGTAYQFNIAFYQPNSNTTTTVRVDYDVQLLQEGEKVIHDLAAKSPVSQFLIFMLIANGIKSC